jgi:hypothetical protein
VVFVITLAQAAQQPTVKNPVESFQVKFNEGYLSVNAYYAPLVKIFDEIRKQAKITVDGSIAPEEKITIQFERVALEEGLKRLAKNISIIYAQGPKDKTPRIVKIVILPEKQKAAAPSARVEAPTKSSKTGEPSPQPEPFKFEFDPTKSVEKKPR